MAQGFWLLSSSTSTIDHDVMKRFYRPLAVLLLPLLSHAFTSNTLNGISGKLITDSPCSRAKTSKVPRRRTLLLALPPAGQRQLPPSASDDQKQPLLARTYSRALRVIIWCATLSGTIDGLTVNCEALSNRNAAQGRISSLQISFDRFSSPLLKTRDFQLVGKDLELGLQPFALTMVPFLFLSRPKRTIALLLFFNLLPSKITNKFLMKDKGKLAMATYRLGIASDDLSSPNTFLRMGVFKAMDYLLRNSVVGLFTESVLAAAKVKSTKYAGQIRRPTQEDQMAQLAAALEDGGSTKLELNKVTIGNKGRLVLDAVAAFPDPSSPETTTSRLDFIVRLALSPLDEKLIIETSTTDNPNAPQVAAAALQRPNGCGIMATNAELKASFNKDTMGVPLQIFGKPIPDLWFPVVSGGLAFRFGNRHRVRSVETTPSEDRLDICGELYFNGDAPIQEKNAWSFLGGNGGTPPPPALPRRKPALPPG